MAILPGAGCLPLSSHKKPTAFSWLLQNSDLSPEIVVPDRTILLKTLSRFCMCSKTYLRTPGAASLLLYFVRGPSTPTSSKKAREISRQRDRILFTIRTKVATLLVPPCCSTVNLINPCSVSIAVISRLSTARGTCSYPAKKSIRELITWPAKRSLNSSTLGGRPASLIVSLFCLVTEEINLYSPGVFFFIKNAGFQ